MIGNEQNNAKTMKERRIENNKLNLQWIQILNNITKL